VTPRTLRPPGEGATRHRPWRARSLETTASFRLKHTPGARDAGFGVAPKGHGLWTRTRRGTGEMRCVRTFGKSRHLGLVIPRGGGNVPGLL
jgi:hypothetical protein